MRQLLFQLLAKHNSGELCCHATALVLLLARHNSGELCCHATALVIGFATFAVIFEAVLLFKHLF